MISTITILSILKPDSYTCRGSSICRVVQQNEGNRCLGPFKCWVSKLFSLISIKMVPYIKENKFIIDISLHMCILLSDIASRLFILYSSRLLSSNLFVSSVSGVHTLLQMCWPLTTLSNS